jgi:hypothetical protein
VAGLAQGQEDGAVDSTRVALTNLAYQLKECEAGCGNDEACDKHTHFGHQ